MRIEAASALTTAAEEPHVGVTSHADAQRSSRQGAQ
jgi:hypothetical protein